MSFWKKVFGSNEGKINSYADFWRWFEQNEKEFYQIVKSGANVNGYFLGKMLPRLQELRDGYHALVGIADEERIELVFSANGDLKQMVFVDELIAAAPELSRWQFTALRPRLNLEDRGIRMGETEFTTNNVHFYSVEDTGHPDEINIVLVHDELDEQNKDFITNGTFIFIDHLLGEWDFATLIDQVEVKSREEATEELVPINKLREFLKWREKEFVEKYEGTFRETEKNAFTLMEATLENGLPLLILADTDLQHWDAKASHPWMLVVEISYLGQLDNGLPTDAVGDLLQAAEDRLMSELKDAAGYLNLGRETGDGTRRVYFACREFKASSKIVDTICREYGDELEMEYDIYKDKYWRSFQFGNV